MELYTLILAMYILTGIIVVICFGIYFNFKKEILKFEDKWLSKYFDLICNIVEVIDQWFEKTMDD